MPIPVFIFIELYMPTPLTFPFTTQCVLVITNGIVSCADDFFIHQFIFVADFVAGILCVGEIQFVAILAFAHFYTDRILNLPRSPCVLWQAYQLPAYLTCALFLTFFFQDMPLSTGVN